MRVLVCVNGGMRAGQCVYCGDERGDVRCCIRDFYYQRAFHMTARQVLHEHVLCVSGVCIVLCTSPLHTPVYTEHTHALTQAPEVHITTGSMTRTGIRNGPSCTVTH